MSRNRTTVRGEILLVGSFLVILGATLWPFSIALRPLTWSEYANSFVLSPSTRLDPPGNVLLFVPFGFGLTSWRRRRGDSPTRAILITLVAGFLVTAFVESMQIFLPHRTPNVSGYPHERVGRAVRCGLRGGLAQEGRALEFREVSTDTGQGCRVGVNPSDLGSLRILGIDARISPGWLGVHLSVDGGE